MTSKLRLMVEELSAFSQRAVSSENRETIFRILAGWVSDAKVEIVRQPFRTPYHFIQVLSWLIGGFMVALLLAGAFPVSASLLAVALLWAAFNYFDWRSSPLTALPPQISCFNFIARKQTKQQAKLKIVFMAHWDTAPISVFYRPDRIGKYKLNVWAGFVLLVLAAGVCAIPIWQADAPAFRMGRILLLIYLLFQFFMISWDYRRFGYANGANDNATGCAAALSLAGYFWEKEDAHCSIELCITGAEEVGMLGAKHYHRDLKASSQLLPTYVFNFDTIGCAHLQLITQSGVFTKIHYNPVLLELARQSAAGSGLPVRFQPYETGDVDTAWFARDGIPCLTFISQNDQGLPAYIHRPEDTIDKIHWATVDQAVNLGREICEQLIRQH